MSKSSVVEASEIGKKPGFQTWLFAFSQEPLLRVQHSLTDCSFLDPVAYVWKKIFGQELQKVSVGTKPQINPTDLTHSTPIDAPERFVDGDLASGSSSASGAYAV